MSAAFRKETLKSSFEYLNGRTGKPYHIVDSKILSLVECLRAVAGVTTIASCEGHARPIRSPYVYFQAPIKFLAALAKLLTEDSEKDVPLLNEMWGLQGIFNQNYELTFTLSSHTLNRKQCGLFPLYHFYFMRVKIDDDISTLCRFVVSIHAPAKGRANFEEVTPLTI